MIKTITKINNIRRLLKSTKFGFAQDWSHIYDGIYKF